MTLAELLTASYADLGYESSPPTAVTTRLTRYINDAYLQMLRLPGMEALRFQTITFASVANQKLYGLPIGVEEIVKLTNTTQGYTVETLARDVFRQLDPQETSTGTPTHWVEAGFQPVQAQPVGTSVWIASSSAGDTTQLVRGTGLTTAGVPTALSGTLNGVTRVQLTTALVNQVTNLVLSAVAVGDVTLYDAAAAGNTLAVLRIGTTNAQYRSIRLWPTASAADTYALDAVVALQKLVNTYDVPLLPIDFHNVLLDYVRMQEYEYRDDERVAMASARYQQGLKDLKNRVWNPLDYKPVAGHTLARQGSYLGGAFPPGRW